MAPRASRRRREPQTRRGGPRHQAHTGLCCLSGSRVEASGDHHLTPGETSETTCPTPPLQERTPRPRDSPGPARQPHLCSALQEPHWGDKTVTSLRAQPCLTGASTPRLTGGGGGFVTSATGRVSDLGPQRPGRNLSFSPVRTAPAVVLPPPLQLCWALGQSTPDPTSSANPTPLRPSLPPRSCLGTAHPGPMWYGCSSRGSILNFMMSTPAHREIV